MPRRLAPITACLGALLSLAACQSDTPGPRAQGRESDGVVVASFNFPESRVLAEIYALALEDAGIPVRREKDLGPRELVRPALLSGLVDVVPEYLGTAVATLEPENQTDRSDQAALRTELERLLRPWSIDVRSPAAAQNQNGFAVTRSSAERLGLRTVSDLAPVASRLTLGGPPECPSRPFCLEGLIGVYDVRFGSFLPFATEDQRARALEQGVVDVAVMFSTDGYLATGDLVLLEDDRRLQPAENVVPLVASGATARFGPRLGLALDAISARLDSNSLRFLNWRVTVAGKDEASEARGWFQRHRP